MTDSVEMELPGSSKEVEVELGQNDHDRNKRVKYYF